MKKSTLRRADLVFSVVLMVISIAAMIESVKLLFNPFGRDFEDVKGDDIKNSIETWYQSVGLVPFIIAAFVLICALCLFHFARREGARFDFIKLDNIRALLKNEELRVAVIVTVILCAYIFAFMPLCREYLDFFPRFQAFPFMIATFLMLFSMMVAFGEKKLVPIVKYFVASALAAGAIAYGFGMLAQQFVELMDPMVLLILLMSTLLGVIIGALPGLSATMGIALLTGLTYKFPLDYTFAILLGVYVGAIYGGSMSAILLNIPGTASAAATALEGHPLALQGKAETAIKVTRLASIIGTFIGILALALIAPPLTSIALKFTSPEYFMLALFGVLICGSIVTSDIPLKGWIGGLIGLLVAQIGMDTLQGASRFDFGSNALMGGIEMVPAMIGFYAIPEVIKAFAKHDDEDMTVNELKDKNKEKISVMRLVYGKLRLVVQSALIGLGIGALPGVGEDVAAWVAYGAAKKTSKEPEKFGTGSYEGAIAPEVGNNAAIGGAMIPMLTLAVPGSPPAAVLLGALMIHNIRPGPMIMRDNPTFIYYVAALLFLGVVALWIAGIILAKPMTKILKVPKIYLMPIVAALSIVGAYAINNRAFDIVVCLVFGVVGYVLDKMQYSPAPIVLGIILGNMIDENFRRSLIVSDGSLSIFVTRPISLLFLAIIVFIVIRMIIKKKPAAQTEAEPVAAASNEEE